MASLDSLDNPTSFPPDSLQMPWRVLDHFHALKAVTHKYFCMCIRMCVHNPEHTWRSQKTTPRVSSLLP